MICKSCGAALPDRVKFCNKCGTPTGYKAPLEAPPPMPTFTPPASDAPARSAPSGAPASVPVFTPPTSDASAKSAPSVPVFTPPTGDALAKSKAIFPPGDGGKTAGMPMFAPPPGDSRVCYCHTNEPAVTRCASCGSPICRDCADSYCIEGEDFEFSGRPLCYPCASKVFQEDIELHKANMQKIWIQFGITFAGMLVGGIIGATQAGAAGFLAGFLIGGCLGTFAWTFLIEMVHGLLAVVGAMVTGGEGFIGEIFKALFNIVIAGAKAVIGTFTKIIKYIFYLIRTKRFKDIAENGLRELTEYYEYTLVRSTNKGVDLGALMAEGGALANNTFAQQVATVGETQALQNIAQIKVTFNEFGEIVRDFQAA